MEEKKKNPVLKVLLIILGLLAVIALCVLSSRFSWFGTAEGNSSQQGGNTSINSEVSSNEASGTEKNDESSSASETPKSEEQTTPPPETQQTTTTTEQTTTPPETQQTTTTTTTIATEVPKPLWSETECSKDMYVTVSCYSRAEAVPGSATVSLLGYGEKVKVVATTDTSYSKLADGSYVHNDYLSSQKPAETTATTTTPPPTTTTTTTKEQQSETPSELPAGFGEGITADPPASCNAFEIEVFTLINDIRVQNGLQKLKWDPTAYTAAKTRVREIVTCWGHYRADGTRCYSVYGEGEEPFHIFSHIGENIASGQHTAEEVVDSWMNSPSHRKNILNPDFENIAIAFYEADDYYHYYWVQEFTTYK